MVEDWLLLRAVLSFTKTRFGCDGSGLGLGTLLARGGGGCSSSLSSVKSITSACLDVLGAIGGAVRVVGSGDVSSWIKLELIRISSYFRKSFLF